MKIIKKLILSFIFFFIVFTSVSAKEDKNIVNLYLFHSNTCPHCEAEIKLLNKLQKDYPNLKIYKYEISDEKNSKLMNEVVTLYNQKSYGVPLTIIGDKVYTGYSEENTKKTFISVIEYYSKYGYKDKVGEYIGNIELPKYEIKDDQPEIDKFINEYNNYSVDIPLIGEIEVKNLTLPVLSVVIGALDGFNPCAMWILLFLISMLIGMKDKKRMWTLGLTFLVTSAIMYLMFMLAWLNVASFLISVNWVRLLIALIALVGGLINLRGYFKKQSDGCEVVDDKKRNKIFDKIRKFTTEKNFVLAIIGVITLAVSVNIVELACSAGLPVMFIEILSLNNLSTIEYMIYILIYIVCFLLDDLIVFIIAMSTLKLTGISTKYGKLTKLIGGILLILIGILLIFKPEWLMFNF